MGLGAERMASSPLTRARETADLAMAAGLAPSMDVEDCLAPGADPLPLLRGWRTAESAGGGTAGRLVLVGHEPDLSLLACHLIGATPGAIRLKKAGLALLRFLEPQDLPRAQAVDLRPGCAALKLLIGPRIPAGMRVPSLLWQPPLPRTPEEGA
jgi:phosphohistidine phosphatase